MKKAARKQGGICLSKRYESVLAPLRWRCRQGHEWTARPQHILKGHWCPRCAKPFKQSLAEMRAYARSRGGSCISPEYLGSEKSLKWQCRKGHVWTGSPANLVRRGTWCPRCAGQCTTIGDLRRVARKQGGLCLSVRYLRNDHNHLWQCREGHRFVKTWQGAKEGAWCFDCMFYERFHRWPKISRGASNREIARETGTAGAAALTMIARRSDVPVDPARGYRLRKSIGDARALATKRGGVLLSTVYESAHEPLQWRCREGHLFSMTRAQVFTGAWCAMCAGNRQHTMSGITALAQAHGGAVVSKVYKGKAIPIEWRCRRGHIFRMRVSGVTAGEWCSTCRVEESTGGLERCRTDAKKHGGECLSAIYLNSYSDLEWQCARGHRWKAPAARIRQGKWCPRCAKS